MQTYKLSKFYRPENVVDHALALVRECGGVIDRIRYPKIGDDGAIWITFTRDGLPDVYRISKGSMGPYKLMDLASLTFFYDDEVAEFMLNTIRAFGDKKSLKTTRKAQFEAICHWLRKDPAEIMKEIKEEK